MPTILFQTPSGIETLAVPALLLFIGAFSAGFATWLFSRRKTTSEIHKSEMDTALSILDRLPDFLKRLEASHVKSLADESTIERLRTELQKCVDGQTTCRELKASLLIFLTDAEKIINNFEECRELLVELRRLRTQLTKP